MFSETWMLTTSILNSMRTFMWVVVIITLVLFVIAEAKRQGIPEEMPKELVKEMHKFTSLWGSMIILFQCVTSGQSWGVVYNMFSHISPLGCTIFFCYMLFFKVAFWSVVTGVYINHVKETGTKLR